MRIYSKFGSKHCTVCNELKLLEEFHRDKTHRDGHRSTCAVCIRKKCKINRKNITICEQDRLKIDPSFRILKLLRSRIKQSIKRNSKSAHTMELIGCTIDKLKDHLQETAIKNGYTDFDINNYLGQDYHIDHIKPCNSFDLSSSEEQKKCFHYSNLQILTAVENHRKGGM